MNKNLEALLLIAARSLGMGAVGVDPERAKDYRCEVGKLRREGELIEGWLEPIKTTGYYTDSGADSLSIDIYSPGDGFSRYRVVKLKPDSTGHYGFGASEGGMTLKEIRCYLQGIIAGAENAVKS